MAESTNEITSLSASQIAELVRTRKLSPIEVVKAHLARIGRVNPKINAFVQVDGERALAQARGPHRGRLRRPDGPQGVAGAQGDKD